MEGAYGRVGRHIAVEAYVPRPDDLPPDVEWVEADIAAPDGIGAVRDAEVDLVFSGQNIEHLWPDQVVAFLVEASRVIRPGRLAGRGQPQPGHHRRLPLEHGRAHHRVRPGGNADPARSRRFEVRSMRGRGCARRDGELLPLTRASLTGLETDRRPQRSPPRKTFIWWAESVKVAEPERTGLARGGTGDLPAALG